MLERRRPFLGVAGSLRTPRARRAHSPGAAAPRRRRPLLRGGCPRSPWAARGLREAAGRVSRVAVVGRGEGGGRLSVANRGQAPRPLPPGLRAAGRLPPASTMRHAILLVAAALAAAPGEKARHAAHAPQCRPRPPPADASHPPISKRLAQQSPARLQRDDRAHRRGAGVGARAAARVSRRRHRARRHRRGGSAPGVHVEASFRRRPAPTAAEKKG